MTGSVTRRAMAAWCVGLLALLLIPLHLYDIGIALVGAGLAGYATASSRAAAPAVGAVLLHTLLVAFVFEVTTGFWLVCGAEALLTGSAAAAGAALRRTSRRVRA